MIKRKGTLSLILLAAAVLLGCDRKPAADGKMTKPVLVINKLELSQEELRQELRVTSWIHGKESDTGEEPQWLSRLIEREVLVQEAQRLGIDREADFMRTIERFWKEALIKILLNRKGQEIGDQTYVDEPEIEAYYQKLVQERSSQPLEPLSELKGEVSREIRQEKETKAMEQWIAGLRQKAKIEIDQKALSVLK